MGDSTKLSELPTDNNINMNIIEPPQNVATSGGAKQGGFMMSNDSVTEVLNGVRAGNGATLLPSRDIPMETTRLTQDECMQPNYVPREAGEDYIKQYDDFNSIAKANQDAQDHGARLDSIYESIQLPLLVGVLFFLFQLPFIRKQLFLRIPSLFLKDGQPKTSGFLVLTSLFIGATYLGQRFLLD